MGCTAHKPELEAAFILSFYGVRAFSLPLPSPGCSHTDIGAGITVTYGSLLRRWSCVESILSYSRRGSINLDDPQPLSGEKQVQHPIEMWCAVPAKLHPNRKSPPRKLYMRKGEYQCPTCRFRCGSTHCWGEYSFLLPLGQRFNLNSLGFSSQRDRGHCLQG